LTCGTLAHVHWPAFSAPSTFFQLAEPLSTTCSSTRSASRQFVTFTVTVPPAGVLGLDFMGAAAAGADSEFCASAAGATTPNSAAAIVTAIRLLMNLILHLARADDELSVSMAPTMAKEKLGGSGHNAAVLARLIRGPGEHYSDVILRLAAEAS
jgi:hypothetical protein